MAITKLDDHKILKTKKDFFNTLSPIDTEGFEEDIAKVREAVVKGLRSLADLIETDPTLKPIMAHFFIQCADGYDKFPDTFSHGFITATKIAPEQLLVAQDKIKSLVDSMQSILHDLNNSVESTDA